MKTYEASAKTVQEAIAAGLEALGVSISDVTVETIDEGSKGLFGLFGSRLAKVRLTVKEEEEDILSVLTEEKPAPKKPEAKKAEPRKPEPKKPEPARTPQPAAEAPKPAEAAAPEKPEKPAPARRSAPKAENAGEEAPKQPRPRRRKAERPAAEAAEPKEPKEPKKPLPPKPPVKPLEKPVVTMLANEQVEPDSAAGKAQAFLRELTRLMGVEVDVAVGNDQEGNVFVQMTGDTLGVLIGRRGETLDALQYLTSLKVNRGQEGYTRVTLDTENYRAKREDTLIRLANRMANRAVKTGRRVSLEPMNPYERRIIHSALQANDAVDTHSEGEEPNRHVVITLRK